MKKLKVKILKQSLFQMFYDKTPLTSIISYIDLLKKENDMPETQKEYIEILEQKSQRLTLLIEDLLKQVKQCKWKYKL